MGWRQILLQRWLYKVKIQNGDRMSVIIQYFGKQCSLLSHHSDLVDQIHNGTYHLCGRREHCSWSIEQFSNGWGIVFGSLGWTAFMSLILTCQKQWGEKRLEKEKRYSISPPKKRTQTQILKKGNHAYDLIEYQKIYNNMSRLAYQIWKRSTQKKMVLSIRYHHIL